MVLNNKVRGMLDYTNSIEEEVGGASISQDLVYGELNDLNIQ